MDNNISHFNKLPSDDGDFLIQTIWDTDQIKFYLHHPTSNKSFKGELNMEEMEETAGELEISFPDFRKECMQALTTHLGVPSFKYELDKQQKKMYLIKKAAFTTTIQYLEIKLRENSKSASEMLGAAVDFINKQKQDHLELEELKEKVQESYLETCNAFEKCLEEKDSMESKLLKKFSLLLNSKKTKIAELQDMLMEKEIDEADGNFQEHSSQPSTSAIAEKNRNERRNKIALETLIDEDDEDYMASTEIMTLPTENVKLMPKEKNPSNDGTNKSVDSKKRKASNGYEDSN